MVCSESLPREVKLKNYLDFFLFFNSMEELIARHERNGQ